MKEQQLELLSAFFDGEAVEPAALVEALEAPGSSEALLEFARLRVEVARDHVAPRPGWVGATRALLVASTARSIWGRWVPVPTAALAAATVVIAALGLWGWRLAQSRVSVAERPPEVSRTIAFEPGKDWEQQPNVR